MAARQWLIVQLFEIASIPQYFQRDCVANTTAEYTILEDGLVKVINSCDTQSGERKQAEGRAKNEDLNTNSKLKVTFVKFFDWIFLFGGNYWIIDLDSEYRFAVVGDPSRKYSWILSRTPELSSETLNLIKENLKKQGYDTCLLLTSIQENGNFKERKRLCDL